MVRAEGWLMVVIWFISIDPVSPNAGEWCDMHMVGVSTEPCAVSTVDERSGHSAHRYLQHPKRLSTVETAQQETALQKQSPRRLLNGGGDGGLIHSASDAERSAEA